MHHDNIRMLLYFLKTIISRYQGFAEGPRDTDLGSFDLRINSTVCAAILKSIREASKPSI